MKFGSLLIRNSIFRGLNIIAGILITFVLLRLLSVTDYGHYSLMMANVAVFNLFTCLGSESGIVYNYSSGKIQGKSLLGILFSVTLFQIILLLIAEVLIHFTTGSYWMMGWNTPDAIFYGLLFLLSLGTSDKYVSLLNAAHLYTLSNKVLFISNFILLGVLSFFLFGKNDKTGIFFLKIIVWASALQALLLIIFFHLFSGQPFKLSIPGKKELKLFFSYSSIVFITNGIQFLAYRIDYWILNYYHGEKAVGVYAVAVRLGQLFWVFPTLFAAIILPKMASGKEADDKILSLMRITIAIMGIVVLIAFLVASFIIPWVGGEEYRPSVVPFWYLLPGIFFFSITIMLAAYFAGINKLSINFRGSLICLLIVVILDFILIPAHGIEGAALASAIAYSIATLYTMSAFARFKEKSVVSLLVINKRDLLLIKNYFHTLFHSA